MRRFSTLAGRFVAPVAGVSLLAVPAGNPSLSYKAVYIVCGAAGVLGLLMILRLPGGKMRAGEKKTWRQDLASFRSLVSHRVIVITVLVEAAVLFSYGTFETFLPLFAIGKGISAFGVGFFLSEQIVTLAVTKPLMGRFSDRHGRPPQIVAGAFLGAASIGILPLAGSFVPMPAISVLFGLSLSGMTSATSAFIAKQLAGKSRLGDGEHGLADGHRPRRECVQARPGCSGQGDWTRPLMLPSGSMTEAKNFPGKVPDSNSVRGIIQFINLPLLELLMAEAF
ncbi:MAG: MFS transporter [Thermoleophilia bacterium]